MLRISFFCLATTFLTMIGVPLSVVGQETATSLSFRVRSNFEAELNSDEGWAGATNEAVPIYADQPFRLRLETGCEIADSAGSRLRLQYRRNAGPWSDVAAQDFPNPSDLVELDFSTVEFFRDDDQASKSIEDHPACSLSRSDQIAVLQVETEQEAVMGLFPWHSTLDEFELEGEVKLPESKPSKIAIVFGDPAAKDFYQLVLNNRQSNVQVCHVTDAHQVLLAEKSAEISSDRWFDFAIEFDDGELQVNLADDSLEFEVPLTLAAPATSVGLHVPESSAAAFRSFKLQCRPETPRVSVITCPAYGNGTPTVDLLRGSSRDFVAGAGINFDSRTTAVTLNDAHSEFEWPLVVRRYADGPVTNDQGDVFQFRMVTDSERPIVCSAQPSLGLKIPPGHLGGTFVETPGRIGPWQSSNGDLYFIMEPTETDNRFMMVKSTDEGRTWQEVDGVHRPLADDLESVDARQIGDTIHIIHQVTEATWYHAFHTSDHPRHADRWAVRDELAGQVEAIAQAATLVARSDGSLVTFYVGQRTIYYNQRSPDGYWGNQIAIDPDISPNTAGPQAVLGLQNTIHLAYYGTDGTLWYRTLNGQGKLGPRRRIASGIGTTRDEYGAILPLVFEPTSNTVIVVYGTRAGELWERRILASGEMTEPVKITDRRVVINAVDSQQPGADVILDDSGLWVLFIEEASGSLFASRYEDDWQPPQLLVKGIQGSWVRGNAYRKSDGTRVYGFVYDAGSGGGSGMNKFSELMLTPQ